MMRLAVALALATTIPLSHPACHAGDVASSGTTLILATTTSTQDSGLLDVLLPAFEKESGIRVKTAAVGSGAALALGARGEADVMLVHAPDAERRWMAQGHGKLRLPVMHNEFVIVGPASDPAGLHSIPDAAQALARVAMTATRWVSRDDGSGTDLRERELWKASGRADVAGAPPSLARPWHIRSGQGMGPTLMLADARQACTLTDRGTWLAWRSKLGLVELVRGDPRLRNEYHVITVRPDGFPTGQVHAGEAFAFARWITGPRARALIGSFGPDRHGEPLFVPASPGTAIPPARVR